MGNGYDQHLNHKGTFLPMLCSKPSIKDVAVPKWQDTSGSSISEDPLSPKISCMGQVKRNNRIVGFPASHKLSSIATKNSCNNSSVKYFKLMKLFSGKNLTGSPAATTAITTTNTATSCRRKQVLAVKGTSRPTTTDDGEENSAASINIETMDPPLPVIKRVPKQGDQVDDGSETLWQRRSRGVALKSLQLQQIQLIRHQEPTTV